jgi:hypothetical protein
MLISYRAPQDKKSFVEKPTTEDTEKLGFSVMRNIVTKTKSAIEVENCDQVKLISPSLRILEKPLRTV